MENNEERNSGIPHMVVAILIAMMGFALSLAVCEGKAGAAPGVHWRMSLATQFGSKTVGDPIVKGITYDRWAGANMACGGKMRPLMFAVAHRTLPCGTIVEICRGKLCTFAKVWDRGPYFAVPIHCGPRHSHRCWKRGKAVISTTLATAGHYKWASDLDLLPRVAFAIRLGGKNLVRWRVVSVPGRKRTR